MRDCFCGRFFPGQSLSEDSEYDRDHESKRQKCDESIESFLHTHVTTSLVGGFGREFVSPHQ
jgi:hypothetical protein